MRDPVLRWSKDLDLPGSLGVEAFLGNPFGVVLILRRADRRSRWFRCILDPETGEFRGSPERFEASGVEVVVVEDTALIRVRRGRRQPRLASYDLLTGTMLWEVANPRAGLDATLLQAPRRPPTESDHVTATSGSLPYDSWRFQWVAEDGHGSQLRVGETETVWRTPHPTFGSWEGPDFIVVHAAEGEIPGDPPTALVIVGTKGELARVPLGTDGSPRAVAIADRTIYCVIYGRRPREASLVALDQSGSIVWERALDASNPSPDLSLALPSRLVCIARNYDNPEISCFDEPSS